MAWVLLVAALALPGWAVAHALIHQHLAHHHEGESHHHAEPPAVSHQTVEGLALVSGEQAHGHGHLDGVLLPSSRSQVPSPAGALPAASPQPASAPTYTVRVAQERAPPRTVPEAADPSHPRAPPHA